MDRGVIEELENKMETGNNLAALRTTMANERTLLAWFRTGAALVACGLAIDKTLNDESLVATTFVMCGFLTGLQGVLRYYQNGVWIDVVISRLDRRPDINCTGIRWFVFVVVTILSMCVLYVGVRISMKQGKDD